LGLDSDRCRDKNLPLVGIDEEAPEGVTDSAQPVPEDPVPTSAQAKGEPGSAAGLVPSDARDATYLGEALGKERALTPSSKALQSFIQAGVKTLEGTIVDTRHERDNARLEVSRLTSENATLREGKAVAETSLGHAQETDPRAARFGVIAGVLLGMGIAHLGDARWGSGAGFTVGGVLVLFNLPIFGKKGKPSR
jgi:hypothetical protein